MTGADFEAVESAHTTARLSVDYTAIDADLSVGGVTALLSSNEPGP